MNFFDKVRKFCSPFRVVAGITILIVGFITQNPWYALGTLPLVAGLVKFCPLCMVTKKCSI